MFIRLIGWGESVRKIYVNQKIRTFSKRLCFCFDLALAHVSPFFVVSLIQIVASTVFLFCSVLLKHQHLLTQLFFLFSFVLAHLGPKEFQYRGKNYFLSSHVPGLAGKKVDWLDGRNLCREYCMDLITLENQEKNNLIFRLIQTNDVPYIWTSGRLCDFKGCENRPDLEPKNLNGWFWSSSRAKM